MPARSGVGVVLALMLLVGAPLRPAEAQEPLVIIVVDFQRIVRESDAAATVREQIDEFRNTYQGEFGRIEEELRAVEAELTELRPVIPDEDFLRRRREFELRVTEAQRQAQYRRAALDRSLDEAMDRIRSSLFEVIAGIANGENATLVLSRANIVLVDQSLDFTDMALAELNEKLPRVDVAVPQQQ